jgi:hypothetical protein
MIKYKSFITVHSVVAVFWGTQKETRTKDTKRRMKDEG